MATPYGSPPYSPPMPPPAGPPAVPGKASRRYLGAYLVSGLLLMGVGRAVMIWTAYNFHDVHADGGDMLKAVFDPRIAVPPLMFSFYQWALAVALTVVALLALMQRAAARGMALVLGVLMLAVAARECIGLARSSEFRDGYISGGSDVGAQVVVTWGFALLAAIVVLIAMGRASEREPAVTGPDRTRFRSAGALLVLYGAASVAWIVRQIDQSKQMSTSDYLKDLADASEGPFRQFAGSSSFYNAAIALGLLVVGLLALAGRPVARGGALLVAAFSLYVTVRQMVGLTLSDGYMKSVQAGSGRVPVPNWSDYTHTTEGKLWLATVCFGLVAAVVALMLLARRERAGGMPVPR